VGLIHRQKSKREGSGPRLKVGSDEALRGHEEETQRPLGGPTLQRPSGLGVHPRVEGGGGDSGRLRAADLIFHQGDEGGHHQGEPVQEAGRHLVAEALSAAGRENAEGVLSAKRGPDEGLLTRPEFGVPEAGSKEFDGIHGHMRPGKGREETASEGKPPRFHPQLLRQGGAMERRDRPARPSIRALVGPRPRPFGPLSVHLAPLLLFLVLNPRLWHEETQTEAQQ
jgi:hypothetical protein